MFDSIGARCQPPFGSRVRHHVVGAAPDAAAVQRACGHESAEDLTCLVCGDRYSFAELDAVDGAGAFGSGDGRRRRVFKLPRVVSSEPSNGAIPTSRWSAISTRATSDEGAGAA